MWEKKETGRKKYGMEWRWNIKKKWRKKGMEKESKKME